MKSALRYIIVVASCLYTAVMLDACHNNGETVQQQKESLKNSRKISPAIKAPGTFQDTLMINSPSAVFYYPDSLQLLKIKAQTDSNVYEGLMHEYFFQMRNARIVIKKTWPALRIIECKKYRYLLFISQSGNKEYIDLDKNNEPYGLLVFDGKKPALLIDMSNVETGISFYLQK